MWCSTPSSARGTTGAVAEKLGRRWIGIERDADYVKAAEERIAKVRKFSTSSLETREVETGGIRACRSAPSSSSACSFPARRSTTSARRVRAEVKADGTLAVPGSQGSIHRLGAIVQGKTACNGWTFWHYEKEGKLQPIDALRERAKVELGLSVPAKKPAGRPIIIAAE